MTSFLKKAMGTAAVSMMAVFGVQADATHGQICGPIDPCCEPVCDPCYGYAYNPPVFFEDCCGWFADIEFLYWKPCQDGISYGAATAADQADPSGGPLDYQGTFNSTFKYPKFEWDSGFRVGLGYRTPCDCWEIKLGYTHYRTDDTNQTSGNFSEFNSGVSGTVTGSLFGPAYSALTWGSAIPEDYEHYKVDALWKVQFNQLDLDFAREFFVGRCVTLKPYAGLRALFIEQKYTITTEATGTADTGVTADTVSSLKEYVKMDNDFKGVGLKAGLDSSWGLGCGLALYGNAQFALVYGEFDVIQRDEITLQVQENNTTTTTTERYNYNQTDDRDCLLAQGDLAFGLRWRQLVNCDRNAFTLRLGWEHHVLFDYNQFRNIINPAISNVYSNSPGGNLSFYGITFAASIEF